MVKTEISASLHEWEDVLKYNLALQKRFPGEFAGTNIDNNSFPPINIQVCNSGTTEKFHSGKGAELGLGLEIVFSFSFSVTDDNKDLGFLYWSQFQKNELFQSFKVNDCDLDGESLKVCYVDYGEDYHGAAQMIVDILRDVYGFGFDETDKLLCETKSYGELSQEDKKIFLQEHLGQFFTTLEDADEFLGTRQRFSKTLPIISESFTDEHLKPIPWDEITKENDKNISTNRSLFLDCVDYSLAVELFNAIVNEDTIKEIDEWAYKEYQYEFKPKINASEEEVQSQMSEFNARMVTLRKSLFADVYNGAMRHLVNHAEARLDISILEEKTNEDQPNYYMVIDVVSSAFSRDLKNIKLFVITEDGKRFAFDAATVDAEAKLMEEYEIALPVYFSDSVWRYFPPFVREIADSVGNKKYKGLSSLRVSKWAEGHLTWSTYPLSCYFPMSFDQIEEVLQPGTKLSVRFGQYDIRIYSNESGQFYIDAFKLFKGDHSVVKELTMLLPAEEKNIEERKAQELLKKGKREEELKQRAANCKLFEERKKNDKKLKQLEEKVKAVDFLIFDNLRKVITNPEKIKEIAAVAKFCENNDTKSLMLKKIKELPKEFDVQAILDGIQAEQLKVAKYNKKIRVSSYISALIVLGLTTRWAYLDNSAPWLIIGLVITVYMVVNNKGFLKSFIKQPVLEGDVDKLYQKIQNIIK